MTPSEHRRSFSLSDFSRGEKLVSVGLLLVLVSFVTHWMSFDGYDAVGAFNGAGLLTVVAWIGVLVLFVIRSPIVRDAVTMPVLPTSDAVLITTGGAIQLAGAVLFYLHYHGQTVDGIQRSIDFGFVIALVGSALTAAAGIIAIRSRSTTLHDDPHPTVHDPTPEPEPAPPPPPPPGPGLLPPGRSLSRPVQQTHVGSPNPPSPPGPGAGEQRSPRSPGVPGAHPPPPPPGPPRPLTPAPAPPPGPLPEQ